MYDKIWLYAEMLYVKITQRVDVKSAHMNELTNQSQ